MANSHFASVASQVRSDLEKQRLKMAAVDRDAEWQRVNSYIADVLKDIHVLYAKLARLQGDFLGKELAELEQVAESVLDLGKEISGFSKSFYEGRLNMADGDVAYGGPEGGQQSGPPVPPAPPPAPPAPDGEEDQYDVPVTVEEEEEKPVPEEE